MHICDLHIFVQNIYFTYLACAYGAYFLHIWYCIIVHILEYFEMLISAS